MDIRECSWQGAKGALCSGFLKEDGHTNAAIDDTIDQEYTVFITSNKSKVRNGKITETSMPPPFPMVGLGRIVTALVIIAPVFVPATIAAPLSTSLPAGFRVCFLRCPGSIFVLNPGAVFCCWDRNVHVVAGGCGPSTGAPRLCCLPFNLFDDGTAMCVPRSSRRREAGKTQEVNGRSCTRRAKDLPSTYVIQDQLLCANRLGERASHRGRRVSLVECLLQHRLGRALRQGGAYVVGNVCVGCFVDEQ